MKFVKFFIGLMILPFCVSATRTLAALVQSLQPASINHLPLSFWGLVIGFMLWLFLYVALPRPMRTYVFGHELTHIIWVWLMGGGVRKLNVSKHGGSVHVTKTNFLIALAPYFFPFYTVCTLITYYILSLFFNQSLFEPFWLGCIGLTWSFHLTFTLSMLKERQPDIQEHGRLFSYAVIYLFNVLGISLWIVMVASPSLEEFVVQIQENVVIVLTACAESLLYAWELLRDRIAS